MNIKEPIIKKINDNLFSLEVFEGTILPTEDEITRKVIKDYPTVYIHSWKKDGKYGVYVGESNRVIYRTRQHFQNIENSDMWQNNLNDKADLYIIGHDHFNKSLTLDVENRLMHYLMSVDQVEKVHNGRGNPQNSYYPEEEFETIFRKIWRKLHRLDKELFPKESVIKDSAIYKASPLHKLTEKQELAKLLIINRIEEALNHNQKQVIFVDGEAGTGKTVLNSSIFYELYCRSQDREDKSFRCNIIVNHDEQVKVYQDIADKLGITDLVGNCVVSKASRFLNQYKEEDAVDVVFVDEAHLLFTQGNQGYRGNNQLEDIVKKAKVTVIIFDENQVLRMDQYWEFNQINRYRSLAKSQQNHIVLDEQLRIQGNQETLRWIDDFTKHQTITKIPKNNYEIRIFESPQELDQAIIEKANHSNTELSRLLATYDWDYSQTPKVEDENGPYWGVSIEENQWFKPWNYQLGKELTRKDKKKNKNLAWAEQKHTINEVGSTYTIQGFDLNYAGVILGKSIQYRNGKIIYNPSETSNPKVTIRRTLEDGSKGNFAEELLKHEVRVLLTRGVNGLYIYACDEELRKALLEASR